MTDYREILYDSIAGEHMTDDMEACLFVIRYYAFLGNYKDSETRLAEWKAHRQSVYEKARRELHKTRNRKTIGQVVRVFRQLGSYEDSEALLDTALQREAELEAADEKRAHRNKRIRRILLAAGIAAVVALVFFLRWDHKERRPNRLYERACSCLNEGRFDEAMESFERLQNWPEWKTQSEEGIRNTHIAIADDAMTKELYGLAYLHYSSAGMDEKTCVALRHLVKIELENGGYNRAVFYLEELQHLNQDVEEQLSETRLLYVRELISEEEFSKAVDQLEKMEDTPETIEMLSSMYKKVADAQCEKVSALKEPDDREAAILGKEIHDLNGQITYCKTLLSLGYDLSRVYPAGVAVVYPGLSGYVPTEKESAWEPGGRCLVLYSRELEGRYSPSSLAGIYKQTVGEEKYQQTEFRNIFYPDLQFALPEENRAESWEDCDTLLLATSRYVYLKTVYEKWIHKRQENRAEKTYACVDSISFFKKEDPSCCRRIISKENMPSITEDYTIADYPVLNKDNSFIGHPDLAWIQAGLGAVVQRTGSEEEKTE